MVKDSYALVGLQIGDEGKGKVVVHLADRARKPLVVRYQGGGNAGHTAVIRGTKYKLHQIPSGILVPNTFNLVDEEVYFNPRAAIDEIRDLRSKDVRIEPDNLGIASNVHVTFDYHTEMDSKDSQPTAGRKHTSTGRGIRQTAVDKYGRIGMRLIEFLDSDVCLEILRERTANKEIPILFPADGNLERFVSSYDEERELLSDFVVLRTDVLRKHRTHPLIAEGANGYRLSVDKGLYPGITGSNPTRIPSEFRVNWIYGVVKLYESSVGGNRPFIGQMPPELESSLRKIFGERGTTTNLPRDLGWFDTVAVKHAIQDTGTDYLVSSCGDRLECLAEMGEKVKLVVAYEIDGRKYTKWDKSFHNRRTLFGAKPVYEEFEPWDRFIGGNGELTGNAQRYVNRIQELVGKEFIMHGFGEGVDDVLEVRNSLNPDEKFSAVV